VPRIPSLRTISCVCDCVCNANKDCCFSGTCFSCDRRSRQTWWTECATARVFRFVHSCPSRRSSANRCWIWYGTAGTRTLNIDRRSSRYERRSERWPTESQCYSSRLCRTTHCASCPCDVDLDINCSSHGALVWAQWLGRQSFAGGLSLIYALSMADMWPLRGSTNQANSAFRPFGVVKWAVIHVITWITGWRPSNGRPGLRMAVSRGPKSRGRGFSLRPACRLYACSVCDVQRRCSCSYRLWRYMSVISLPFTKEIIADLEISRTKREWVYNFPFSSPFSYSSLPLSWTSLSFLVS